MLVSQCCSGAPVVVQTESSAHYVCEICQLPCQLWGIAEDVQFSTSDSSGVEA